jgi:hypothetical protein
MTATKRCTIHDRIRASLAHSTMIEGTLKSISWRVVKRGLVALGPAAVRRGLQAYAHFDITHDWESCFLAKAGNLHDTDGSEVVYLRAQFPKLTAYQIEEIVDAFDGGTKPAYRLALLALEYLELLPPRVLRPTVRASDPTVELEPAGAA